MAGSCAARHSNRNRIVGGNYVGRVVQLELGMRKMRIFVDMINALGIR